MLDSDTRLLPETKLILAVITQAILDARKNKLDATLYLIGIGCKGHCALFGLDHDEVLKICRSRRSSAAIRKSVLELL